jgi:hypothetical protein
MKVLSRIYPASSQAQDYLFSQLRLVPIGWRGVVGGNHSSVGKSGSQDPDHCSEQNSVCKVMQRKP